MSEPAAPIDSKLLDLLVCPLTKGPLRYDPVRQELISEQGFRSQVLEGPGEHGAGVLRELENAHVIRADSRRGINWYEISHDRLVAPILASAARRCWLF